MMDTSTCSTIVLILLWLPLCCQTLGFFLTLIDRYSTNAVLFTTTTLSTVLLGICLWQCKKAGYLVSPMTWYHWVLLVLLVLLQIVALVLQQVSFALNKDEATSSYPIYGVAVVILAILGGTLFCGWKCNLFCRPCCKSQYICYGSAIVVVLVVLIVLGVTVSIGKYQFTGGYGYVHDGQTEMTTIGYLNKMAVPISQIYAMAIIWNTTLRLPYTLPEVVTLISSAMAMASIMALAVFASTMYYHSVLSSPTGYSLLAAHLICIGITLYCIEYKGVFHWPKDYMCFGLLAAVVILVMVILIVAVIAVEVAGHGGAQFDAMEYILLGYSLLLMIPTLWYAYRCGLLTWKWNSCLPKKRGLNGTDTAENTAADTDIAKES